MSDEADRLYPIRITEPAANDIRGAFAYLREINGDVSAGSWEEGFYEAIRTLSRMPRKHPVAELESRRFGLEVRQMTYGRRGGVVYRVLFQIIGDNDDAPFVRLLHVRHAARRPMTKKENAPGDYAGEDDRSSLRLGRNTARRPSSGRNEQTW